MLTAHFESKLLQNGNLSWTLTTRLGELLKEAENKYGPRDINYTPLGVEFFPSCPHIWYPGNCGHISIRLALNALNDETFAVYQLAHECIHLLAPTGQSGGALVFEEGLATVFSENAVLRICNRTGMTAGPDAAKYIHAAALVRELLKVDPDVVKKLRQMEPSFNNLTMSHFTNLYPNIDQTLVTGLLTLF